MSIVFFAGLPRSSTVGIADLFYQHVELKDQLPLLTGHPHLAAALTDHDLGQFDSPLHLYKSHEALIRCLLKVHGIDFSLDSYLSILNYYSSQMPGLINSQRLQGAIHDPKLVIIDPSFSHSLYPNYLVNLADVMIDLFLIVVWRNPISFCMDLMHGVFAFDCCLQWILAYPSLSFPLDPLSLWVKFTNQFLQIPSRLPSSFRKTFYLHYERIHSLKFAELTSNFSCNMVSNSRPSALVGVNSLLSDCPFSGDPSNVIQNDSVSSLVVSKSQLARFSLSQSVIDDAIHLSQRIGYALID